MCGKLLADFAHVIKRSANLSAQIHMICEKYFSVSKFVQ